MTHGETVYVIQKHVINTAFSCQLRHGVSQIRALSLFPSFKFKQIFTVLLLFTTEFLSFSFLISFLL